MNNLMVYRRTEQSRVTISNGSIAKRAKVTRCILPSHPISPLVIAYHVQERLLHLFDTPIPIHLYQLLLFAVIVEQLNGFIEKDIQPRLYCFSRIVRALTQRASID